MAKRRERTEHLLKGAKTTKLPRRYIAFDTETHAIDPVEWQGDTGPDTAKLRQLILNVGWAVFVDRDKPGSTKWFRYTSPAEFWDWVDSLCSRRKEKTMLLAHNLGFDNTVLKWQSELTGRLGWELNGSPMLSRPRSIRVRKNEHTIHMVDTFNYYAMPLKRIGDAIGLEKLDVEGDFERPPDDPLLNEYCKRDVEIVAAAWEAWLDLIEREDFGPFRISVAGQAFAAYSHRFMNHDIVIHNHERTIALERAAYHGGRTEMFWHGPCPGNVTYLDVNSMYSAVMRDQVFPTQRMGYFESWEDGVSFEKIDDWISRGFLVIVECDVKTDRAIVPKKIDEFMAYPIGTFRTSLCTPEYVAARDAGIITAWHKVSAYRAEPIFTDWVNRLYDIRLHYRTQGNEAFATIVKNILNSLYGKWGQHNYDWEEMPGLPPEGMEETGEHWSTDGTSITYRTIGDKWYRRSGEKFESYNAFVAIASHVTSYARVLLSGYRDVAGWDNVYYCDTDSLFVSDAGYKNLVEHGALDDRELGKLKIEKTSDDVAIVSSKYYHFGEQWRRKGIRANAKQLHSGDEGFDESRADFEQFRQDQFVSMEASVNAGHPNVQLISSVTKVLSGRYSKGTVNGTGWVKPIRLRENLT